MSASSARRKFSFVRNTTNPGQRIGTLLNLSGHDTKWLSVETGIAADKLTGILAGDSTALMLEDAAVIADALGVELPILISENVEEAVGIPQIARMLHISTDTVYRKARAGEIPGFKLGGLWRFFPSEVKEHIKAPKVDPWAQSARSLGRKRVA